MCVRWMGDVVDVIVCDGMMIDDVMMCVVDENRSEDF